MSAKNKTRASRFSQQWWIEVVVAGLIFTIVSLISALWGDFDRFDWESHGILLLFSPVIGFVYKLLEDLIYYWFGDKKKS